MCLHVSLEGLLVLEGLRTDGTLQHPVLAVGADVSLEKIAVSELHVAELAQQRFILGMCAEVKDECVLPGG